MTNLNQFARTEYARIRSTHQQDTPEIYEACAALEDQLATMVRSKTAIRRHRNRATFFRESAAEIRAGVQQ